MEFRFPDVGEGISEGEIVNWQISEGEKVEEDQVVVEIETDKAIVEIPSPVSGTVTSMTRKKGETVEVGEVLMQIDTNDGCKKDNSESPFKDEQADQETVTLNMKQGDSNSVVGSIRTEAELLEEEKSSVPNQEKEILATPSTRRLAQELGVDIRQVKGSGKNERVTDTDIRRAASELVGDEDIRERRETDDYGPVRIRNFTGIRRAIAQQMSSSASQVPQATQMDQADVTNLYKFLEEKRAEEDLDFKLTLMPYFIKAVISALKEYPKLNASVEPESEEIIIKDYYNIGIGVDTDHGLMVPVVHDADEKSIPQIGRELEDLARLCRNRNIELDRLKGGSFTITNIGFIGGKWATPQVNYPEAAILATGRADWEPAVVNQEVIPRRILPLSVSFDHRIIDGADVARFINHVRDQLEETDF